MPRIRTIKPEFFLDDELGALPSLTRLFFVGLWTQADRAGRLKDKPTRLKTAILPYDHDADGDAMLSQLEAAGFLSRYEVDGERFIEVRNFTKHQRFKNEADSILPPPPRRSPGTTPAIPPECPSVTPALPHGKEGKGKEEERRKPSSSPTVVGDGEFDEFWRFYPRKVGRAAARAAWKQATKKVEADVITNALRAYPFKGEIQFVPHPATWLNQERWADETGQVTDAFAGKDYGVDPC